MATKAKFQVGERVQVKFNNFDYAGTIIAYLGGSLKEYVISFEKSFYLYANNRVNTNTALGKLVFPEYCIKKLTKTVTFVYEKSPYDIARRTVEVQEENSEYLCGLDVDDGYTFKKFLKAKIVGPIKAA